MIHEKYQLAVPAAPEVALAILKDVEGMDAWLRPHLPRWPKITASTWVVERTDDGDPLLVAAKTSALGISDETLTAYRWTPDGVTTTLRSSRVLRSSQSTYAIEETAAGTSLMRVEVSADVKIRLPRILERRMESVQRDFATALQRAFVAEAERRRRR
ncbi:hypothetical protein GOARA_044_00130 [Gordonia araii NBRC 100433]|uniref:Coenzyme Q-binding protein COQ10 START domain-containing protein n=1 Tax=Gordonia araii NBRC 100433 TaxID=1073574 RepID=G7H1B5_9ACTN|nr:SRPBCC family protein [Gordonia araii]NNG97600.1 hypothetical protein [Gordonia araii NBRC 100433]GAB09640.1 hypothetical protein GOARA_044_00130 [Gordonia araii NBRC 100433]